MQSLLKKIPFEFKDELIQLFEKQEHLLTNLDHRTQECDRLLIENKMLREQMRLLHIRMFGSKSEKLNDRQLELLTQEPSVSEAEVDQETEQPQEERTQKRKKNNNHPGRVELPAHLERRELKIPCSQEDCTCPHCQSPKDLIGYDRSEELDVIPAQYFVKVILREKRACPSHPEGGVVSAPLPEKIIPKSKLSNAVIVDVLTKKYGDHLPAYRQSMILERDANIQLSRKTLTDLIMKCGDLLGAFIPVFKDDLWKEGYIQADETRTPCQSPRKVGSNVKAFMWEYSRPHGPVVFDFQMGRSREGPANFLKDYGGILQSDGYSAYDKLGEDIRYAGCWVHARREFDRAHKLQKTDPRPVEIMDLIGNLYEVESEAREAALSHGDRLELRQKRSLPIMKRIQKRILEIRTEKNVLPKSQLAKACTYAINQWPRLELFLKEGQLELDNNWCENAIRAIAVGRKNWLHIGSEEAGPRVAAIMSIYETCRRLKINVRDYLLDVMPRMPEWPIARIAELTPMAWKARQVK